MSQRTETERLAYVEGRGQESLSAIADIEFFISYTRLENKFLGLDLDVATLKAFRDHLKEKHEKNHD